MAVRYIDDDFGFKLRKRAPLIGENGLRTGW